MRRETLPSAARGHGPSPRRSSAGRTSTTCLPPSPPHIVSAYLPRLSRDGISSAGGCRRQVREGRCGTGIPLAVVDYAHAGDALERLITTARQLA
ncbi:MAG: hypothetical protein M0C28_17170 [Candidatus Moduliflexus flocculans]|nr:hypothetical protein [Candidatus Moduliflexus flocculans]